MVKAYILVNVKVGHLKKVVQQLKKIKEISRADAITGPYDVLCTLEVKKLNDLTKTIIQKIDAVEGVNSTLTLLVVDV